MEEWEVALGLWMVEFGYFVREFTGSYTSEEVEPACFAKRNAHDYVQG